jgi:hypothetical protein
VALLLTFLTEYFMAIAAQILHALDHSNDSYYCSFISLGHPYSYLIDSRLNLFRADEQWAIAIERLGYNPRGGSIELEIFYYGNCLINLDEYNNHYINSYGTSPIEWEDYLAATADELLNPEATTIVVRGTPIALTHDLEAYAQAGIELVEYKPRRITMDEAGRLLVRDHAALFRATDQELYKSLPKHLQKILVLDEWHHRDFDQSLPLDASPETVEAVYQTNQTSLETAGINLDALAAAMQAQQERTIQQNQKAWEDDRPSSYETWQQVATVLASGDTSHYRPTLPPNTHWSNWPDSGSL